MTLAKDFILPLPGPARRARRGVLVLPLLAVLVGSAHADRYVTPTGTNAGNDCTLPASPCATIQHAIDQATSGEAVHLAPGSYAESLSVNAPLKLLGARAGEVASTRTAGAPSESILDVRGFQIGIAVSSSGVTIDGLDVVGGGATSIGIGLLGNNDLSTVAIRNSFVRGMKLAHPPDSFGDFAYGILSVTGAPAARRQIGGLAIQGNEIFDIGVAPGSAGAGIWLKNVVGAAPGAGAIVTGNSIHDLASLASSPNHGAALVVDAAQDDANGLPVEASSGLSIAANSYADVFRGVVVLGEATDVVEASTSFSGVTVLIANVSRLAGVDHATLGRFARSDDVIALGLFDLETAAYFTTIQKAIDSSKTGTVVDVSAGTFDEAVVAGVGVKLRGAKAGQDARVRDTTSGETIVSQGIRVRASGVTIDGFVVTNSAGPAVHADAGNVIGATVKNVFIAGGPSGIHLEHAQSGSVSQNLIRQVAGAAIDAGSDGGTTDPADDVITSATIQDNLVEGSPFGVVGYLQLSSIRRNLIENHAGAVGAAVSAQVLDGIVESNTILGYTARPAVLLYGDPERAETADTTFRCNDLTGNLFGVLIESSQASLGGVVFTSNNFDGNSIGLANQLTAAVDASFNWWGCAAGPGDPACDPVVGAAVVSPFLTGAVDCSSCSQHADCQDGITCNGAETCDAGTSQCQTGAPPSCDLGGGNPGCNVASCIEGRGCVVTPVADGTACVGTVACSVPDSCRSGLCAEAGGGDDDGDLICAIDDNCPADENANQADVDQDGIGDACDLDNGNLDIEKIAIQTALFAPNGSINAKAALVADPSQGPPFDASGAVTVTVADASGFFYETVFGAAECGEKKGTILCRSLDKTRKIKLKPNKKLSTPGAFKVKVQVKNLDVTGRVRGPITMRIEHSNGLIRSGSATECSPAGLRVRCEG